MADLPKNQPANGPINLSGNGSNISVTTTKNQLPFYAFCFNVSLILGVLGGIIYSPIRPYESSLYALLVTLPFSLAIMYALKEAFLRHLANAKTLTGKLRSNQVSTLYLAPLGLVALLTGAFLVANQVFDHTAAETILTSVVGKHRASRKRSWSYYAHLYGFNQWFDSGGAITNAGVYLNDTKAWPASACDQP